MWLCPDLEYFVFREEIKKIIFCHNSRSSVCLILRQTVDRVESIGNYLDNWLVDNYLDNWLVDNYADPENEKTWAFLSN